MHRSNWLLLALAVCALAETGAHFFFRDRAPSEQQWRDLKPAIAKIVQPNDCVAIAPDWGDPLARRALGGGVMPIDKVARGGDEACERIIEVGFLGQRYAAANWPQTRHATSGPFSIWVRSNPHWAPTRYAFVDHLEPQSLVVSVQQGSAAQVCPFTEHSRQTAGGLGGDPTSPAARYSCPGGSFHWVGATIIDDERYRPRRCIWAPPNRMGSVLLQFKQVPLGRRLVGHAGGPWLMVRDGVGPPIELAATIGTGAGTSFRAHFKDTDGWVGFEWDTRTLENAVADVALTVTGTQNVDQRFCFTLDAR